MEREKKMDCDYFTVGESGTLPIRKFGVKSRGSWLWSLPVIVLMAAYCLPSPYATLWPDTVRDLSASLAFARGQSFPLAGPPINFGPHMGPAWIWLQALPLVFFSSLTAVSVYVALVASLKFLLLFELGRAASGPRLGICLAAAAAFPSVLVFHWIVFFHPDWVEAAIVAGLLALLMADQRRSTGLLYAGVALLGLAIQIHPTAAFYLPLAAWIRFRQGARGLKLAGSLAVMLAIVAIWFAPLLWATAQERGSLGAAADRVALGTQSLSLDAVATVLRSAYIDLPLAVGETYGVAGGLPLAVWQVGLALVDFVVIVGAILRLRDAGRSGRRLFAGLFVLLLAAWVIATGIRTYTSFYLVYFLFPLSAIFMGLALDSTLTSRWATLRGAGWGAVGFLVLSFAVAAVGACNLGEGGLIDSRVPALGDLRHPGKDPVRGSLVGAAARDSFARMACAQSASTVSLHGDIAYVLAASTGLDLRVHCPASKTRFLLLGKEPGLQFTALPAAVIEALHVERGTAHGAIQSVPVVEAIHPPEGRPIEPDWYQFDELRDRRALTHVKLEFEASPAGALMIYRLKPFDSQWRLLRVEYAGAAVEPAFTTYNNSIYRVKAQAAANSKWVVEFDTDAPQWVDVHTF
jgi:hypothetical protein